MNSRKRSQGGDEEQPQPTKKKRVVRKTMNKRTISNCSTLELLLATRPPVLLMFLLLLSRQVVSWSSRSEDNSPLSISHLVSRWGVTITIYDTVIVNGRIQYKISIASDRKNHSITLLTHFEITSKYNNVRDYSTRSFYTALWNVRYSPSLLLMIPSAR